MDFTRIYCWPPPQKSDMISQLRKKLEGEKVRQIASLTLHFSMKCNLRCAHCNYAGNKKSIEISDEVIDTVSRLSPIYTCITGGGEPTYLADSSRFAQLIKAFPDRTVYMLSNGTIIPSDSNIWVPKFDFIRISLDAGSRDTYQQTKGVDYYDIVINNIEHLLSLGVNRVGVSYLINKSSIEELPDLLKKFSHYFFKYGYRFFMRIKPLRENRRLLPSPLQVEQVMEEISYASSKSLIFKRFIEEATDFAGICDMHRSVSDATPITSKCYYSLLYVLVTANGDVFPCGLMSRNNCNCLGNLNSDSWDSILDRQRNFFESLNPIEDNNCRGCWEVPKNIIMEEIVRKNMEIHPALTKLGGYSTLYCRY